MVIESTVASEPGKQLSSLNVLKHHVDVLWILESGLPA